MINRKELLEIGQYNKPHGIKGEISATIDCDTEHFSKFSCLISDINGIFVPFFVNGLREKSADTVLLSIDGIENEDTAKTLVNKTIYVKKQEFSNLSAEEDCDEMPIDYFIGFTAKSSRGNNLGEISDIDDSTDNILFIITGADGREYSIPAVEEFIVAINEDSKTIILDLPDGILDI